MKIAKIISQIHDNCTCVDEHLRLWEMNNDGVWVSRGICVNSGYEFKVGVDCRSEGLVIVVEKEEEHRETPGSICFVLYAYGRLYKKKDLLERVLE